MVEFPSPSRPGMCTVSSLYDGIPQDEDKVSAASHFSVDEIMSVLAAPSSFERERVEASIRAHHFIATGYSSLPACAPPFPHTHWYPLTLYELGTGAGVLPPPTVQLVDVRSNQPYAAVDPMAMDTDLDLQWVGFPRWGVDSRLELIAGVNEPLPSLVLAWCGPPRRLYVYVAVFDRISLHCHGYMAATDYTRMAATSRGVSVDVFFHEDFIPRSTCMAGLQYRVCISACDMLKLSHKARHSGVSVPSSIAVAFTAPFSVTARPPRARCAETHTAHVALKQMYESIHGVIHLPVSYLPDAMEDETQTDHGEAAAPAATPVVTEA